MQSASASSTTAAHTSNLSTTATAASSSSGSHNDSVRDGVRILKPKTIVEGKDEASRAPVKLILLGDSAVGKSKLVERFLMQRYVPVQMSTYALTLFHYDFVTADGDSVDVDIWDTAGQERFATMHPAYYHDAHACIFVFDMTRKATYKNLEKWLAELRNYREHIPCLVACNKIDTDPSVTSKAFAFADKHNFPLHYVSAADGTNVVRLFEDAISIAAAYKRNPVQEDFVAHVLDLLKKDSHGGTSTQNDTATATTTTTTRDNGGANDVHNSTRTK